MDAWRQLRGLPKPLWLLFLSTLVNRVGTMVLPFLILYLTTERGLSPERAAFILGLNGLGSLVITPVGGWLCDRWGAVPLLIVSLVSGGLLIMLYPLVHGFAAIAALTLVWALVSEACRPATLTAVSAFAPPDKRKPAFALHRLATNLGMSIGPAAGGFLAQASFPALFAIDGLSSLLAGVLLWLNFPGHRRFTQVRAAKADGVLDSIGAALQDARLVRFSLVLVVVGTVFFQHVSSLSLFVVRDLGMNESTYGILFSINTLLIIALEVPLNFSMRHWPHRRAMTLGTALIAVGFGLTGLAHDFWGAALAVTVWTFGEMVLFPTSSAYVAEISPPGRQGAYMSLYLMSFNLAFIVAPAAGVHLRENYGVLAPWAASFAAGMAAAAAMWIIHRPRQAPAPISA